MSIELTSSILVAEIGKPPDVSESHRHTDAGKQEIQFVSPTSTSVVLCRRCYLRTSGRRRRCLFCREFNESLLRIDEIFLFAPVVHFFWHGKGAVLTGQLFQFYWTIWKIMFINVTAVTAYNLYDMYLKFINRIWKCFCLSRA